MVEAARGIPQLVGEVGDLPPEAVIFGHTAGMHRLRESLLRVATALIPVLIEGESGTGKEIIAKFLHHRSLWGSGLFVKVSCPAIPTELLESELFGYERGSFTGADRPKPGRVEAAEHGTLFLDEISELDGGLQAKLLQVLQDGQFCRIGAQEDRKLTARVVCATNRNLETEVEQGKFRRDLFYRINVARLQLLPLRERALDIPDLANYFLERYNLKFNGHAVPLPADLLTMLQEYHWPGNTRELENVIKRYVILGTPAAITSALTAARPSMFSLPITVTGPISLRAVTKSAVRELEAKLILQVLEANGCNRKKTAKALNISYRALLYKIREAGLLISKSRGRSASVVAPGGNGTPR